MSSGPSSHVLGYYVAGHGQVPLLGRLCIPGAAVAGPKDPGVVGQCPLLLGMQSWGMTAPSQEADTVKGSHQAFRARWFLGFSTGSPGLR